jgi:hypothetical protein
VTADGSATVQKACADDSEDFQGNNDSENLHLWADRIGKTWEWRAKKQFNSEWKTCELREDGSCVFKEGVKREVKSGSTATYKWQIADNSGMYGTKGHLLIVPVRNGKPFFTFSRAKFEKQYPAEMDPKMH